MNRRRTTIAVLALVALALITFDFRDSAGPIGALQRGVYAVFDPIATGVRTVVRPVGNLFATIGDLGNLRAQIEQLREDNARLRDVRVSIADLERENAQLRALLNMVERTRLTTVGAQVIAAPASAFEFTVIINAGAAQGITEGMAVITTDGFVGHITEVTADRARVQLLIGQDGGANVRIAETGTPGLLFGQGSQPLRLELLDEPEGVPEDPTIVTQASQASLVPDGIPVGELVIPEDGNLAGRASLEVHPYVDFARLSVVAVVIDAPETPVEFPAEELIDTDPGLEPPRVEGPSQQADQPAVPGTEAPTGGG